MIMGADTHRMFTIDNFSPWVKKSRVMNYAVSEPVFSTATVQGA
jgi:hypothetical protein